MNKEKATLLAKMQELKDKRESEISNQELDIKIVDVKYLGKIKWIDEQDGSRIEKEKDIFMIVEDRNGSMVYKYYDENMEMIAAQIATDNNLLPNEKYLNKEDKSFLKNIEDLDKQGKSLEELEKEKQQEEKGETKSKEKKKEETKEQKLTADNKGAIDLDQIVDGESLRNILGLDGTDKWLKAISASKIKDKYNTNINTKEGFEVIKQNGEARYADESILKFDSQEGNNSFDKDLKTNVDGTLEYKSNIASFESAKRPGRFLAISYGKNTSTREISYAKRSGREGHSEVEENFLNKGDSRYQDPDQRNMIRRNEEGIGESDEIIKREQAERKAGCEEVRTEDVDNYKNNDTNHINPDDRIEGTDITWKEFANRCGYRGPDGVEKVHEMFINYAKEHKDMENEEIISNIEDDMIDGAPGGNRNR